MLDIFIKGDIAVGFDHVAVDAQPHETFAFGLLDDILVLSLAPLHQRRQHHHALPFLERQGRIDNLLNRLPRNRTAALDTMLDTDTGKKQPQIIINFGDRADCRARIFGRPLLFDGNGGREPVNQVNIRLFHQSEKLPGVSRKRLDIPPLPLGVNRVEGQRGFSRAG